MSYASPYSSSGRAVSPVRMALSSSGLSPTPVAATPLELPMSDILYGYGEWRDVQPVVRSTLKTLYDTVQQQANTIRQLQRTVAQKTEPSDLSALEQQLRNELGGKLSYGELNAFADDLSHRMVELNAAVSRKPDATEIAAELLELRTKLADNTGPAVSRYLEMQAERTKATAVESQRQLASHSGLVSDALEVAARHREVELEAQKVWVDDQLRKLKKGILETVSHEASERERNVLALWKEVRSVSEVLNQEQSERRHDTQHTASAVEALKERVAAQQHAALNAHEVLVSTQERETSDRLHSHNALRSLLVSQIEGEMEIRTGEVAAVKEQLRTLDAMCEGEKVARGEADQALEAGLVAAEKRLCTQHELATAASKAAEEALHTLVAQRTSELDAKMHALGAAAVGETSERKAWSEMLRSEQRDAVEDVRSELSAVRTELAAAAEEAAAAEAFLTNRSAREVEDRKRAAATMRAEVTRELEGLALTAERRAVEVQATAVEHAMEHTRHELAKRDPLYDELKRHCDFCTKGTADEVVQMWQYVQRIDGDVRDVVLRLDNRMAKIYGRTWK